MISTVESKDVVFERIKNYVLAAIQDKKGECAVKPTSLLICVVRDQDALKLVDILREKQISFTKLASTGGFYERGTQRS